jgi:cell division transport system permease protein
MKKKRNAGTARNRDLFRGTKVWLGQHGRALMWSAGQLLKNPLGNLFSVAVIGVSLALPSGFFLILDNTQRVLDNWQGNISIALYLQLDVADETASSLQRALSEREGIESVRLITREEALAEYKAFSGFGEALDALEENPLPSMLLVQPDLQSMDADTGQGLLEQLAQLPEVESAQLDRQWVKRLFVILDILERSVIILTTVLSIAVLLIIGNTIRLSIINKRSEIEINKLFGATNTFIQRPFLYTGVLYGLSGSLLAWILLIISTFIIQSPVNQLAFLYNSEFNLEGLSLEALGLLFAAGGGLGLVGSWIAVGRHLRQTEPV